VPPGSAAPSGTNYRERTVTRTADEVRASVYSLSSSAPHLFGDRLDEFDDRLRGLLADGTFSERLRGITTDVWR